MTSRSVSIFCNNYYFPIAVPILNSLRYFDVQAKIKVYDHSGLNHLLKTYLKKFVKIIELPDPSARDNRWIGGCKFRPTMIAQTGFDDAELFLDTDMVALNNMEEPLRLIESGLFVGSSEWLWGPGEISDDVSDRWKGITGKLPPKKFEVFNGGIVGLNFSNHYWLARKWSKLCNDKPLYRNLPFNNDQMIISGLVKCFDIKKEDLPRRYWMTTWERHNRPPKLLGFDTNGKIKLCDSETGKSICLYHYTGGVGRTISGGDIITRYYHARGESITEPSEFSQDHKAAWKSLWEDKYGSPAGMLAEYMRDAGPIKVPKTFSADFRSEIRTLLGEFNQDVNESMVYATCIAYDYITLLDYRLGNDSWLERPLRALLGSKILNGDKVLKWDAEADIRLNFGKSGTYWAGCVEPGHNEHIKGVDIITHLP